MRPVRAAARSAGIGAWSLILVAGLFTAGSVAAAPAPPDDLARTWYVATDGDDQGEGTSEDPFATWQRGIRAARAGDRILIRPGTYDAGRGVDVSRSGRRSAPITLAAADPADRPVLDCSELPPGRQTCVEIDGSWWRVDGIEVVGTPQRSSEYTPVAILIDEGDHNRLDRVAAHHNEGIGIALYDDSRHNVLRNCDAYYNADRRTDPPYENGDGVDLAGLSPTAVGNKVVACRFWWNADDGIDLWESEAAVTVRRSWSFRNGYVPGTTRLAGNGQGFKLGRNFDGPRHVLIGNLAFANRSYGFDENGASGPMRLWHNTAFRNGGGQFAFYAGLPHELRNNLAVPGRNDLAEEVDDRSNSWTLPVRASRRDFRSVSWTGADGPRRADGGLPRLPFLRLRAGSDLVDAGSDLGQSYEGRAPDLGAYESKIRGGSDISGGTAPER